MAEPSRVLPLTVESVAPAHVLILEARYYETINRQLLAGAEAALTAAGATFDVVDVPGALEIPIALAILADGARAQGRHYSAAVVLGCVIRGETYHFEIVSDQSNRGVLDAAVARHLPLGNGILTVESEDQALVRSDPRQGDKGGDAARAALSLLRLKRKVEAR